MSTPGGDQPPKEGSGAKGRSRKRGGKKKKKAAKATADDAAAAAPTEAAGAAAPAGSDGAGGGSGDGAAQMPKGLEAAAAHATDVAAAAARAILSREGVGELASLGLEAGLPVEERPIILVAGDVGGVASAVISTVSALASGRARIRALLWDEEKGTAKDMFLSRLPPEEVTVEYASASRPGSVERACEGVWRAFIGAVGPDFEADEAALIAALAKVRPGATSAVQHVVKTSTISAAIGDDSVVIGRAHARLEKQLAESGVSWTVLRPNLAMQMLIPFFGPLIKAASIIAAPLPPDVPVSFVDGRDVAHLAAFLLTCPTDTLSDHVGKIHDCTGDQAITMAQLAEMLTEVLGRSIIYIKSSDEAFSSALTKSHIPPAVVSDMVQIARLMGEGKCAAVSTVISDTLRQPARTIRAFFEAMAAVFGGAPPTGDAAPTTVTAGAAATTAATPPEPPAAPAAAGGGGGDDDGPPAALVERMAKMGLVPVEYQGDGDGDGDGDDDGELGGGYSSNESSSDDDAAELATGEAAAAVITQEAAEGGGEGGDGDGAVDGATDAAAPAATAPADAPSS